jgi:hypothetical protein
MASSPPAEQPSDAAGVGVAAIREGMVGKHGI